MTLLRSSVSRAVAGGIVVVAVLGMTVAAQRAAPRAQDAFSPLANPIANAPDNSEHDTQSTTAIVKVLGQSIVVAAFNNTKLYLCCNGHMVGWSRSTDNGTTWTDGGTLPDSALGDGGDPVLARDTVSGKIYLATRPFTGAAVQVFRSTDNGATWLAPVNAAPGFGANDALVTPWITVDNFPGPGQGNVYVIARNIQGSGGQPSGSYVTRSTDGGATFGPAPGIVMSNIWVGPSVAVGLDHAVYAFAYVPLGPSQIRMRKSTDRGATWGGFVTAATLTGTALDGDLGLGGGFATNSNPKMAVDPVTDELSVFYNDKTGADKADIYVVSSDDGGATWNDEPPFRINNDSTTRDQFMPTATFTPDGKRAMVTWYDRRSDPANSLIERWGVIATKLQGGSCCLLSPNFRISTGSWPVVRGQDSYVGATYMGSYDQITAASRNFWVPWGDNRLPNPTNTPLPHANQPDVRIANIPINGPPRFEFDRDFQTDYTVFRPGNGVWYTAMSGGGAASITGWGTAGDIDVPGDYDGDAKTDIAVFRPSSGLWLIVQSSNGAVRVASWGQNGDIPMAGDLDGDGKDDLVIFRPSNGNWFASLSRDNGTFVAGWGVPGDIPLLGDFNGDGGDDIVAYRPSTGVWYINSPYEDVLPSVGWGVAGDIPVAGDFDGDTIADPTIFRPSSGQWFVKKSTGGTMVATWGQNGDIPVSGDFDGDGTTDITIWRDSNGVWFSQLSAGGIGVVGWGISGDKPSGRVPGS